MPDDFQTYAENPMDNLFEAVFHNRSSRVSELKDPNDTRAIRSWKEREYDTSRDGGGMWNPLNWAAEGARAQHSITGAAIDLFTDLF
jgi:hypothetical protein